MEVGRLNFVPKLFECIFYTINYNICYSLHPDIMFVINLDGKVWHHMKLANCPSSQSLKNKEEITLYHLKLYSWLHFVPPNFGFTSKLMANLMSECKV